MSSAIGVVCRPAAARKPQDQPALRHHRYQDQHECQAPPPPPPDVEQTRATNQDYLSGMRESLFRLLSKVPIQIETVRPTTCANASANHQNHNQQQQQQSPGVAAQRQSRHRSSDHLRDPLVIKYYQERSLANIIDLHFACSLIGDTNHHHPNQCQSLNDANHLNQQHSLAGGLRPMGANVAKSADKERTRRPPPQCTMSNKLLQGDKFNGQTKNVVPDDGLDGVRRLKQARQRRALRLQQQQQRQQGLALEHTKAQQLNGSSGQVVLGGRVNQQEAEQGYRLAESYHNHHGLYNGEQRHPPIFVLSGGSPADQINYHVSSATNVYDDTAPCQQDQFVFGPNSGHQAPQIHLSSPPCVSDANQQQQQLIGPQPPQSHVLYAPAEESVNQQQQQLDYGQQNQQYQLNYHQSQFPTHPGCDHAQQQFTCDSYGALAQSGPASELHAEYTAHAIQCDSQHQAHQSQSGCALGAWNPDQAQQAYNGRTEQYAVDQARCSAAPSSDQIHQTFIHFNVTNLNQMIEQQQQQQPHESELRVSMDKCEYFQKHQASYNAPVAAPMANNANQMPRNQLMYRNQHPQQPHPPGMTSPMLVSSDSGVAHARQASSLESHSSSSSSSSSCSSSSSSTNATSGSAGPTTPTLTHLDDCCLHLEQINPPLPPMAMMMDARQPQLSSLSIKKSTNDVGAAPANWIAVAQQ